MCPVACHRVVQAPLSEDSAVWIEPKTGMVFVRIEPGAFVMGSPAGEAGREEQEIAHRVVLSQQY